MPYFILILLSLDTFAVTISKIMSQPEGTSVQSYKIEKGTATLERKTNYFGPENDLRLGNFTSKNNFSSVEKRITALIPSKDAQSMIDHQIFFKLNDSIIDPASPIHRKLETEFAKLQGGVWKFQEGLELSNDLQELHEYHAGKLENKKLFPEHYHCQKIGSRKACVFKDQGILYVR